MARNLKKGTRLLMVVCMLALIFSSLLPMTAALGTTLPPPTPTLTPIPTPVLTPTPCRLLVIKIGTVEGNVGDTVTIPVSFDGQMPSNGVNNCDFELYYDPNILDVSSVAAGPIIINPAVNFSSNINQAAGKVNLLFVDETGFGVQAIKTIGLFATITAKIKAVPEIGSSAVTVGLERDFRDYNLNNIPHRFVDGKVLINALQTSIPTPTIVPTPTEVQPSPTSTGNLKILRVYDKYSGGHGGIAVEPADVYGNSFVYHNNLYYEEGTVVTLTAYGWFERWGGAVSSTERTITFVMDSDKDIYAYYSDSPSSSPFTPSPTPTYQPTPTIKPTPTQSVLYVTIPRITGATGTTVQIPISFNGVPSQGINNCNFALNYDPNVLDVTAITAGPITVNPGLNFSSYINSAAGSINILFVDETGTGTQAIKTNGVFANITATVKTTSAPVITVKSEGVFNDYDLNIIPVEFVILGLRPTPTPTITPTITPVTPTVTPTGTPTPVHSKLTVHIASADGPVGTQVQIPISFSGVPLEGIGNCDFVLSYNLNVLDVTAVTAGPIIINPSSSFTTYIDKERGRIYVLYCEDSGTGSQA
ncbi:MAG: cohesin domain-containing protein, partial [Bacillota bacterium]